MLRTFSARDGNEVVLRTPRWEDLEDLLELINSLVEEEADISRDQRLTREQEADWLAKALSRFERDEIFYVVAEVKGKVIANSEIGKRLEGYDKHVGVIGIAIMKGYRDVGIGTIMMKTLLEQAKAMGLKVLTLNVFESNARAIHVYKRIGFAETGRVPRRFLKDDKYVDEVIMTLVLE